MGQEEGSETKSIKQALFNTPKLKERDFSFRYKAALHLAAVGGTAKEISEALDIGVQTIRKLLSSESAKEEIHRIQFEIFQKDPQRIFRNILPKAVNTAYGIMLDEKAKEAIRVDAAFRFMDRALGKPVQEIKQETSGLKDVFDRLDALEKKKAAGEDISDAVIVAATPVEDSSDPLDDWMKKNL